MSYPISFGKYLLLERINVGGMAEVFKAKAFGVEGFERILAIKRILPNMADDEEFINMFIDEARIAVQLSHVNVVPIYELGKFENQYYIAMEYVPGKDLRQILDRYRKRNETLPIPAGAFIASKICEGLDYAHRKTDATGKPLNLIHRDVSPQNILVSYEGAVKITDFGIVKAEDRASKTQAGVLKGKFGYMSPEQVRGLEIDSRSDIFAVGILFYEMITGKRLFIGESDFSTLEKVRNAEVAPPSTHNPAVTPALDAVMLKALARERDERYTTAADLHDDLQQFLIEDNTVFTSKKLAGLLQEEYKDEIEADRLKMEEFLQVQPRSEERGAAEVHRAAPTGDWSPNARAEKTVIFESGLANDGEHTRIGAAASEEGTMAMVDLKVPEPSVATGLAPSEAESDDDEAPLGRDRKRLLKMGSVGAVATLAVVLAVYLIFGRSTPTGTLVVSSTPTDSVSLYLDNVLVGQKTPMRLNVPSGEHRLLARSQGFLDRAYRFDLVPGAPAEIRVELERAPQALPDAVLEITSEPEMASVRIGGLPQGVTPVSIRNPDTARPITLEVGKPGFKTQLVTAAFAPGERHKTLHVKLLSTDAPDSQNPNSAPIGNAKITVRSRPDHCTVYLGGEQKGTTPLDILGLSPHEVYALEVSKDGFHSFEENVRMNGRTSVTVEAKLSSEGTHHSAPSGPSPKEQHGGGGPCGGSGGKLSVTTMGVSDCRVTVGKQSLGVAPFYKQDSPAGRCSIEVKCVGGKHYSTNRYLKVGNEEKIIIKPENWE